MGLFKNRMLEMYEEDVERYKDLENMDLKNKISEAEKRIEESKLEIKEDADNEDLISELEEYESELEEYNDLASELEQLKYQFGIE